MAREMTITAAIRQAVDESSMYRVGDGWATSTWSPAHNATWVSNPAPYDATREGLTRWRAERAVELVTGDSEAQLCREVEGPGTVRERVVAAVEAWEALLARPDYVDDPEAFYEELEARRDEAEYQAGIADAQRYLDDKRMFGDEVADRLEADRELARYNRGEEG